MRSLVPRERNNNFYNNKYNILKVRLTKVPIATPKLSPDGDHLGISPTVCLCSQAAEVIFDCAWPEFSQSKSDERRFDLPARYGLPPSRFKGKR